MLDSLNQLNNANKIIPYNFNVTKNIPIDNRFIVTSLNNLDNELPIERRYNGLIFFVADAEITDGVNVRQTGVMYIFENDLSNPRPLHEISTKFLIKQITITNNNYTTIIDKLNQTFSIEGSIINILPLNITVLFDGINWKYFNGVYNVLTEEIFNTIPLSLRIVNGIVNINDLTTKIIDSSLELTDYIIVESTIPAILEKNRYYLINNILYNNINGVLYKLNKKTLTKQINLIVGENIIIHNFNSNIVKTTIKFSNIVQQIDNRIIDDNSISIKSNILINNCEIILETEI